MLFSVFDLFSKSFQIFHTKKKETIFDNIY